MTSGAEINVMRSKWFFSPLFSFRIQNTRAQFQSESWNHSCQILAGGKRLFLEEHRCHSKVWKGLGLPLFYFYFNWKRGRNIKYLYCRIGKKCLGSLVYHFKIKKEQKMYCQMLSVNILFQTYFTRKIIIIHVSHIFILIIKICLFTLIKSLNDSLAFFYILILPINSDLLWWFGEKYVKNIVI